MSGPTPHNSQGGGTSGSRHQAAETGMTPDEAWPAPGAMSAPEGAREDFASEAPSEDSGDWSPSDLAVLDAFDNADEDDGTPSDGRLAEEWRTDLGNARRLVARHRRDLRFVREIGWLAWTGQRWKHEPGEPMRRAHMTAESMIGEARAIQRAGRRSSESDEAFEKRWRELHAWGVESSNHARAKAMINSAEPYLALERETLDADPWRLNVANGTLHLGPETGGRVLVRRLDFRRSDYATLLADVAYDPGAKAPRWTQFVAEVQPDPKTRIWLQRWLGYCLTGDISEQSVCVWEGKGANGKSTLIDVVARLLGDYAVTVPVETFLHQERRGGSGPTPDLARLPGARVVRTSEPEPGARLSESTIKQFTGGERITARHLFKDMFEFRPAGKLTMSVNIRPVVVGKDHGIRRRIKVVPFKQQFARTPGLTDALLAERSGVLNWLIDGYRLWREEGLGTCPEIEEATRAYFEEMDPIGSFIEEACEQRPDLTEFSSTLWEAYQRWCQQSSEDAKSPTAFGRRLTDMGFGKRKSTGIVSRVGLKVKDEWKRAEGGGRRDEE